MLFDRINLISVFFVLVFLLPIVVGVFRPLTASRIYSSINTTLSVLIVILSLAAAIGFSEYLFSNGGDNPVAGLFKNIPVVWYSIVSQDILVYFLIALILLIGVNSLLQLLLIPLNKKVLFPLSVRLGSFIGSMHKVVGRTLSGLWRLPKSVLLVLVFVLLFNFYSLVSKNSALDSYINSSQTYRLLEEKAVGPIISSQAAQQIPAFINNTVDKAVDCLSPEGRKLLIKVYINGVTVDEAVQSSPDIDNIAIDLVDTETDRYEMAELLYGWVADNIIYDSEKALSLETDAFAAPAGAVPAFSEKKGVCFDKACLYVAMCRAVGVRVRLVTGHAFNGADWLDHSWNQIYDDRQARWVNVDPTFGSRDRSYFDSIGFSQDHKDDEIQGEW
jgi:hypothetical protein